jgi:hypothetical protein
MYLAVAYVEGMNPLAFSHESKILCVTMPTPPPCTRMGRHCRELTLTLRIADLQEDGKTLQDAAATWLLGHTERITFGKPYVESDELLVDATVHVPCKYLHTTDDGAQRAARGNGRAKATPARCSAHGFTQSRPRAAESSANHRPTVRRNDGRMAVFFNRRQRWLDLPLKRSAQRALPVLQNGNPCVDAPCRTADNKRGAACCRDLTLDIVLPDNATMTEALLRARKSPYLCKVTREGPLSVECEVISACAYLEEDRITCGLHDRILPNGRPAKPSICREWPELGEDEVAHPGCRLV